MLLNILNLNVGSCYISTVAMDILKSLLLSFLLRAIMMDLVVFLSTLETSLILKYYILRVLPGV
jgi:hypothetical protein